MTQNVGRVVSKFLNVLRLKVFEKKNKKSARIRLEISRFFLVINDVVGFTLLL